MSVPTDHNRFLRRKDFPVDKLIGFTTEEREILKKFGYWMEALATRRIKPITPRQLRFLNVVDNKQPAKSAHEIAWMKYRSHLLRVEQERSSNRKSPAKPKRRRASSRPPVAETKSDIRWACNGAGKVASSKCPTCRGHGAIKPDLDAFDRYGRGLSDVPGHIYRDDSNGNRSWK